MCRNYVDIRPMRKATLLHQVLNFLVVFWVTNTRYDFGECTIETAVPENVEVALGIFDVSFTDSEIGGGVKFSRWKALFHYQINATCTTQIHAQPHYRHFPIVSHMILPQLGFLYSSSLVIISIIYRYQRQKCVYSIVC